MPKFRDQADWTGVRFQSVDVGAGNKPKRLNLDGYQYATEGELRLAVLLTDMGIPFTPDIPLTLTLPNGKTRLFVPDFVFNREPFIWCARGKQVLIHGIEAKGKTRLGTFSERALENVRLLRAQRGIAILLLSNAQIKQYFFKGRLPLKQFEPSP